MSDYWQKMKAALYKQNTIEEQLESNQQLLDIAKADEQKLGEIPKAAVEKKQKLTKELTTAKAEHSRLVKVTRNELRNGVLLNSDIPSDDSDIGDDFSEVLSKRRRT